MTGDVRGCLSDDEVSELAEGLLASEQRDAALAHLAGCAPCRALVGEMARSWAGSGCEAPADAPEAFTLRPVDPEHYEVGREIARGGMGRILEAWDRRHQRRVAIKVLLRTDAASVRRFTREARITAQLQHPTIAPLYEAGRWSDGEPFFAMKLVAGRSLGEVVGAAATLEERLALLPNIIAVTDALAYAHEQRIVHRDLKPANVLIGAFGDTVVLDWGLAKALDAGDGDPAAAGDGDPAAGGDGDPVAAGDEDPALTVAGRALGTPCYMPPEQARGEPVDARADVYALGALLYHVLAGAPPFDGRSSDEMLARVLTGPPEPLAGRAPGLAPDLVTVVEKAMARNPAERYPSAKAMAADLRRYAEGQLVSAHRYSPATLLRRWILRHRAVFAMAAVLVVALSAGGAVSVRRVVWERDRADQLKGVAEAKERAAVARRDAAESLTEYMVVELRARLGAVGRLDLLAGVGAEVGKYYQSVSALDDAETTASLAHRAAALDVMGDVESAKGDYGAASARAKEAIALREQVIALAPGDREARARLAESLLRLAAFEAELTKGDEALAAARRAVSVAGDLLAEEPSSRRELLLASAQRDLAKQLGARGDTVAELAARKTVRDILVRLTAAEPQNFEAKRQLGETYAALGLAEIRAGRFEDGLVTERAALALLDELVARDPKDAALEMLHSDAVGFVGNAQLSVGDLEAALASYERCVATRERLAARDPANGEWQRKLGQCLGGVVEVAVYLGRLRVARAAQLRALPIDQAIVAEHPESETAQRLLALDWMDLGKIALEERAYPEALEDLDRALTIMDALLRRDPARAPWKQTRADVLRQAALAELGLGRHDRALDKARQAEAITSALVAGSPESNQALGSRGSIRAILGRVRLSRGEVAEARRALEASLEDYDLLGEREGFVGEWVPDAPQAARDLARVLVRSGETERARKRLVMTLEALQKVDAANRLQGPLGAILTAVRADLAALGGPR